MKTIFLIVDDLSENRLLLRRLIEGHLEDADVIEATGGQEALTLVDEHHPDILLLDAKMPDLDGFEVCKRIKANPLTRSILVLMVSGYLIETKDRISGLESGADGYICKPFEHAEMIAQLRALMRIRRSERELITQKEVLEKELVYRRRIEIELAEATATAERAAQAKSQFLAHMSHEIRTPMNAVVGMTEVLLDTQLTAEQEDYVQTIQSAGETLLTVINDILDFSKIESGKLDLEQRPFRVADLLDDALKLVRATAAKKGLALTSDIRDGLPTTLIGDTIRLRQILSNLLSNAVKFTESGSVTVTVTPCRLSHRRCELHFEVRDTGIGIPREKMDRLFQSFSQVDTSTTRRYGGTGLGLAISKRLAELMGGRMWVDSTSGQGSTFHVQLALNVLRENQEGEAHVDDATPLAGRRVLIVDDNEVNRRILTLHMKAWGMRPVEVESAEDALTQLEADPPLDAMILDQCLPGAMDGCQLAEAVRQRPRGREVPLILLSSTECRPTAPDGAAAECPFAAMLTKPMKASELFDVLIGFLHDKPPATAASVSSADQPNPLATLRILVAEDNIVNQKVVVHMLRRFGCQAAMAGNGREAVEALREHAYDVVLMDVQMPEMDGTEATRKILDEWPAERRPRIVAMTAHAMQGDRERYLSQGMDDYISKPLREDELRRVLTACLKPGDHDNGESG